MRLRCCCVSVSAADAAQSTYRPPSLLTVIPVLGVTQILAWGSSYYLLAVLAQPITADTGWSLAWVVGRPLSRPAGRRHRLATRRR